MKVQDIKTYETELRKTDDGDVLLVGELRNLVAELDKDEVSNNAVVRLDHITTVTRGPLLHVTVSLTK